MPVADDLTALRTDFPDVPGEVMETWLLPHVRRDGFSWPPPQGDSDGPWARILAGRPVSWWQARIWRCEALPLRLEVMSHAVQFQVRRLIATAEAGQDYLKQSRERVADMRRAIAETGTWPVPIVAYPDSDGLALVDGHHRFAALEMARAEGGMDLADRHRVWIALPPEG